MKKMRITFEIRIPQDADDSHVLEEAQAMAEDFAHNWAVERHNTDIDESVCVEEVSE